MKNLLFVFISTLLLSCTTRPESEKKIPVVCFLDVTEDATLEKARKGFFDALAKNGFSEDKSSIAVFKSNANGDIPTLNQSVDYLLSKKPDVLATNATLATITAVQRSKKTPICMMVSPRPDIAGLADQKGHYPANLFGVYETLDYIDTSVTLIKDFFPQTKIIGTIYNPSEPQSRDAFSRLESSAAKSEMKVISMPVYNSSETQLVTQSLLAKKPDVFFALPDNVIFGSFETVAQSCNAASVPIFTSEAGLVSRGALASFGADFYQWGYQAGEQAVLFLKNKSMLPKPELVKIRLRVYNKNAASKFGVTANNLFIEAN